MVKACCNVEALHPSRPVSMLLGINSYSKSTGGIIIILLKGVCSFSVLIVVEIAS